ncbi:MAG: 2-C-methyl-D-erythritol 2,4-cyclodiphosphate synthase [Acidimicrobiia bacterium]|nr:2-C-methyl-D-erythritol 2,4-cyclodiphosphate synthase [Acidimicrobiia bacterium]MBT8192649.1 2-C-methyl-D-erythritol 2,4-cyclodiphosphate synthase [Acidimicrobiia bacterium]NNF88700.1 2-C-methyl-D-erythritol 2,4-cyclodiphosphate synthase [Acidimicrobiia bacterium]NNL13748.1 2-C-methyl-D-erythritol 2,4-cyclodiphosphate synthase [Acidimicrobiia bacterium]NNL98021.1 2-C-methyl-D-erythritol 2,4-cyclodiphosphate synthase [Acidimicrobiia bacterium]
MRVSWGFDAHRLGGDPPVLLAGVVVDSGRGVLATSDGDLVAHAVADALLGAAGLGDLGAHFPSSDPRWEDADSMGLLTRVVDMCSQLDIRYLDVTVIAQEVRVAPHRTAIEEALAAVLGIDAELVSVKATTTDGMGAIGAGEGIAATAVVTAMTAATGASGGD